MKTFLLCSASALLSCHLLAQDSLEIFRHSPAYESAIWEESEEEADKSPTLDRVEYYRANPVNINAASFYELTEVPFLPISMALMMIHDRDSLGILTRDDLDAIFFWEPDVVEIVSQFLSFESARRGSSQPGEGAKTSKISIRSRETLDLEAAKGFRDGDYMGSRMHDYHRLQVTTSIGDGGLIYDKDPGERFNDGFAGGYLCFDNIGIIRRVVMGDYTINAGEGLMLAGVRSSSMGGSALYQMKATGRTIVPHLATDESHYFEGAAAQIHLSPTDVTLFVSHRAVDASVDSENVITSLYTTGLFRSSSELARRHSARETSAGGIVDVFLGNSQRMGLSAYISGYDRDVSLRSPPDLQGRNASGVAANTLLAFDGFTAFGEIAAATTSSRSGVVGFIAQLSRRISFSGHFRSYASSYFSPFAYGFGEQNGAVNGEEGLYIGLETRPLENVKISMYRDDCLVGLPGSFPQTAREFDILCEYTPSKSFYGMIEGKQKTKSLLDEVVPPQGDSRKICEERSQQSLRASMTYRVSKFLDLTQRIDLSNVSYGVSLRKEWGMLAFTDAAWSLPSRFFYGAARIVFFSTTSYDSRMYEFEGDVRGGYSFPPLSGRGVRWYFVCGGKVANEVDLSLKYSETMRVGVFTTGSGDAEILGPLTSRVTFQADIVL